MSRSMTAVVLCLGMVGVVAPADAQLPDTLGAPVAFAGVNGVYARPVGDFYTNVRGGGGGDFHLVWPVRTEGPLALRADAGFVIYGSETRRVCFSGTVGCRVELDLTTTNSFGFLNVGPELVLPRGPVRPYVNATAGFSVFSTSSNVTGHRDSEPVASTTHHSDFTFSWAGGAGLLIPLGRGAALPRLDIGARYLGNGEVEYLKKGDIQDNEDGSISMNPTRSQANVMLFRIGFSLGLRLQPEPFLDP